jgi:uncharacterized protein YbjQ (UPF0145 family)
MWPFEHSYQQQPSNWGQGPYAGGRPIILSTTSVLEGKRVVHYLGLVSGEAILGANIFKDLFASIRDIVGGRSAAYEQELRQAKQVALQEMIEQATQLGANAIIGIDLDYETLGQQNGGGMLMVCASGTAVLIEE